jgi:hypothetical protein
MYISPNHPNPPRAQSAHQPPVDESRRFGTLERESKGEELRISLGEYKGYPFVSLRVWFKDQAGDFYPTKKGVTLRPDEIGEAIASLRAIEDWLDRPREARRGGRPLPRGVELGSIPVPGRSEVPFDEF